MITAVIPAYNAEKTIGNIVKRTKKYVNEVIVVDDGSRDSSALIAKKEGAKVVIHPRNLGKAAAIVTGLKQAKGIIVTLDADLQHLPEEIPKLVEPVQEGTADLCLGSRFLGNPESMPLHRKFTNYLSKVAIRIRTGQWITDVQSGFRAFNLCTNYRQSEGEFLDALEKIRVGKITSDVTDLLESRLNIDLEIPMEPVKLFALNTLFT